MYKVSPLTIQFEMPADFQSTMYRMKSLHFDDINPSQSVASSNYPLERKQAELIFRIEAFLKETLNYVKTKGLPEQVFSCPCPQSATQKAPTNTKQRVVESKQQTTCKTVAANLSKLSTCFKGHFEFVCQCSKMLPFSVLSLVAKLVETNPNADIAVIFYTHSSMLVSTCPSSERDVKALQSLKQSVNLNKKSENAALSLTIRVILGEFKDQTDLHFYLHDFNGKQISDCMIGESIFLRSVMRLVGAPLDDKFIGEYLKFSEAANNHLRSDQTGSKQYLKDYINKPGDFSRILSSLLA